jgi:hypothetical protein
MQNGSSLWEMVVKCSCTGTGQRSNGLFDFTDEQLDGVDCFRQIKEFSMSTASRDHEFANATTDLGQGDSVCHYTHWFHCYGVQPRALIAPRNKRRFL